MANAQIYCSANELIADLKILGNEPRLMQRIREASQYIARDLGYFLPILETRAFDGVSVETLDLHAPLLSITAVRVDGVIVTDYVPKPTGRCWLNGPYTWLTRAAGWGTTVEIDGRWGLSDETESLGVDATQTQAATTLVLTAGNVASMGMVLQVEDEQQLITAGNGGDYCPAPSVVTPTLAIALDGTTEEVRVTDGSAFAAGEVLQIGVEDLYIRKIGGNTLICARGWNATTQATHAINSAISVYRTYTVLRGVNGTLAAAHAAAPINRLVPPADVRWLALQIAALMRQKASTAFSGRAGNSEAGETFYVNEFPRQIESIKRNYAIPYL